MKETHSEAEISSPYETVIGLEVHCQLNTASKIFSSDSNSFASDPNTNLSELTLALPGTLPRLNRKAVESAIKMGLACGGKISKVTIFDRKNYFYPDLPKGYQISQDKQPICSGGSIAIKLRQALRSIRFHHIHLEEDAGKSVHNASDSETYLDFNRAGTPLIEIVSEPELHTAEEAAAYLLEIRRMVRYLNISDGNMEEGSLRADVNLSLRKKGEKKLGTRVEIKNMNSTRYMTRAIEFEQQRQAGLLNAGKDVRQETRTFDVASGKTVSLRLKETMNDYRYFPDPDLSPLVISEDWLREIEKEMPVLPQALRQKFEKEYGIPAYDAEVLTDTPEMASYYQALCSLTNQYKAAANWLMGSVKGFLNESGADMDAFPISAETLAALIELVERKVVSHSVASQRIFPELLANPSLSPESVANENGWLQNSNTNDLETFVEETLAQFSDKVKLYQGGKKGLLGLFVGEIMKKSGGTADPKVVNEMLLQKLDNE